MKNQPSLAKPKATPSLYLDILGGKSDTQCNLGRTTSLYLGHFSKISDPFYTVFLTHGKPITCYIKLHSDINYFIHQPLVLSSLHQPHLTNQVHISPFVLLLSHHSPLLETSIFAHCHHISYLVVFIQSPSPPECT